MADARITTSPSRRAMVAGLAAAPLAAIPAVAIERDPVFAAIAEFDRADAAWLAAQAHADEIMCAQPWDVKRGGRVRVGTQTNLVEGDPDYGVGMPVYAYSEEDVIRWTGIQPQRRPALLAELQADIERQKARRLACGMTQAEEAADAAFDVRCELEAAALRTIPTTPAGAVFWAEFALRMTRNQLADGDDVAMMETVVAYLQQVGSREMLAMI